MGWGKFGPGAAGTTHNCRLSLPVPHCSAVPKRNARECPAVAIEKKSAQRCHKKRQPLQQQPATAGGAAAGKSISIPAAQGTTHLAEGLDALHVVLRQQRQVQVRHRIHALAGVADLHTIQNCTRAGGSVKKQCLLTSVRWFPCPLISISAAQHMAAASTALPVANTQAPRW